MQGDGQSAIARIVGDLIRAHVVRDSRTAGRGGLPAIVGFIYRAGAGVRCRNGGIRIALSQVGRRGIGVLILYAVLAIIGDKLRLVLMAPGDA